MSRGHVLVVRLDRMGDVLISGPAVRAVAAGADRVTMLVSSAGAAAARLLPGVDDVLVWDCPWVAAPPPPFDPADVQQVAGRLAGARVDEALVLTSFHQSALPTALLLRLAGIDTVAGIGIDYPGRLLTTRVADPPDAPEPVRMLAVAEAAGFRLPGDDPGTLRAELPPAPPEVAAGPYVVVHPGASAPARSYPPERWAAVVRTLSAGGRTVLVTGGADERALTAQVAGAACGPGTAVDLGGALELAALAHVLRGAEVVAVGNTGPAHLAAAVGTPVVSLFAPVVPASRWVPWGVPVRVLGDQQAGCRDTRARTCPVPGHPCLNGVTPLQVCRAIDELEGAVAA